MKDPEVSDNHAYIEAAENDQQACLLGTSNVKMTMLRDFGGN